MKKPARKPKSQNLQQVRDLAKYFDQHDEIVRQAHTSYKTYASDQIEDLEFQAKLVEDAANCTKKIWTAELATGIGKSVIAARIAGRFVDKGPVIYVSPSAASIGDTTTGVINRFLCTMRSFGHNNPRLGTLNDLSAAHDVSFITPWSFAHQLKNNSARILKLLQTVSCLIVDEAQHFPEDKGNELIVYGRIFEASKHVRGLTVAMTGTWSRLDQKEIMGVSQPDVRIPVQATVNMGRCPELYAVQVITKVKGAVKQSGNLYDFHLSPSARDRYLASVAECILTTHRRYPRPFAVFARTVADATSIAKKFNASSKLGSKGIAMLTGSTPLNERKRVIAALNSGELAGYATCAVGEEALDIPTLEVVHLVRRTKSIVRNMQAIGRALRVHPGKKRALVVDYQTMVEGLHPRFLGITCDDIRQAADGEDEPCRNGGAVVRRSVDPAPKVAQFGGMTMAEERAFVIAGSKPVKQVEVVEDDLEERRAEIRKRVESAVKGRKDIQAGWVDKVVDHVVNGTRVA